MAETPTTTQAKPAAAAHSNGHPPVFIATVGVGFLALFVVGVMTQVQTNEAFITNAGQVNVYKPDWALLLQIPSLVFGGLNANEAAATIFGWGIELIYLGFIVGYEMLKHSVVRSGQMMAKIFISLSWAIVAFNMYTDYQYGSLGGGQWGHLGFAVVTSFIVGFFGTIGLFLLEHAWKRS